MTILRITKTVAYDVLGLDGTLEEYNTIIPMVEEHERLRLPMEVILPSDVRYTNAVIKYPHNPTKDGYHNQEEYKQVQVLKAEVVDFQEGIYSIYVKSSNLAT